MSKRGELVWHAFVDGKWAITEPMFKTMRQILAQRRAGIAASESELAAAREIREQRAAAAAARREMAAASGNVYVVPVCGIITQRASLFSEYSGGCAVEDLVEEVREAMAMPSVAAVVLDFDSPGGSVYGVPEAFDALKALRGAGKPLVAFVNPLAASAGYWLASACESISCTPSGEAGSVGVYMSHTDFSGMNEQIGIDVTYIAAGRYKVEGNSDEPLSGDAKAYYQKQVDDTYAEFVADVSEGRGISTKDVIAKFGEGRCLLAKDALAAGMVDNVCTFDELIQRLTSPSPGKKGRRGDVVTPGREARATGPGSRREAGCTTCGEACACDQDDACGPECPDCDPGCPCLETKTDAVPADNAEAAAAARDQVAVSASAMAMERRR
jgi:signal peptide peptidase SppA